MRRQRKMYPLFSLILILLALPALSTIAATSQPATHPELSEQEMLIDCASCHKESTPEVHQQWYDSVHGIAMVKCYQCHGTFETFTVTPTRENCATCHANMMEKCPADKPCWECHVPHEFKAK